MGILNIHSCIGHCTLEEAIYVISRKRGDVNSKYKRGNQDIFCIICSINQMSHLSWGGKLWTNIVKLSFIEMKDLSLKIIWIRGSPIHHLEGQLGTYCLIDLFCWTYIPLCSWFSLSISHGHMAFASIEHWLNALLSPWINSILT